MATAFHFLISKRLPLALALPFFSSTGCVCSTCSRDQHGAVGRQGGGGRCLAAAGLLSREHSTSRAADLVLCCCGPRAERPGPLEPPLAVQAHLHRSAVSHPAAATSSAAFQSKARALECSGKGQWGQGEREGASGGTWRAIEWEQCDRGAAEAPPITRAPAAASGASIIALKLAPSWGWPILLAPLYVTPGAADCIFSGTVKAWSSCSQRSALWVAWVVAMEVVL